MRTTLRWIQLLVLLGCGQGSDDTRTIIPATTKVLDDAAQATLVSYSSLDGTIVATLPSRLAELVAGDVVVSDMVPGVAPRGFLRKVTGVSQAGGQVTLTTVPAALVDAIDTGELATTMEASADMVDMTASTGDPTVTIGAASSNLRNHVTSPNALVATFNNTRVAGLTLNGRVAFDMRLDAMMLVESFELKHFRFVTRIDMDSDLTIDGTLNTPVPGVGGVVPIYTIYFTPIAFAIGPIPIVITPRLVLSYGTKITAQITVAGLRLESSTTAQVGTDYTPATGWVDQSFSNGTGSTSIATFPRIGLTFDTYARAETAFMLYDVIGPYVWSEQGLIFNVAIPRDPVFRMGIHVRGGMGGRVDLAPGSILNLLDFSGAFLDVIGWFFSSPNTPPFLTVNNPLDGDYTEVGRFTPLSASAFDLEDGPLTEVHWSSDRDGDLGTGNTVPAVALWRTGPGIHTITTTVSDSDSVPITQVARVRVLNQAPVVSILTPRGPEVAYLGSTVAMVGAVTSPFVGLGDVCTTSGWTFQWTSSVADDVITDGTSCNATIRFGGAEGPRTLNLRVDDPWPEPDGLSGYRRVIVNAQPRPPTVFSDVQITSPPAGGYDADMDGVLPTAFTLTGTVSGPPTPVGTVTYTWTAVAYDADGNPGAALPVGTGNNLTWQPASTSGLLDTALNSQRVDLILHVTDGAGNTGSPDGAVLPLTLRYAPG
jgi:hypothetical protein